MSNPGPRFRFHRPRDRGPGTWREQISFQQLLDTEHADAITLVRLHSTTEAMLTEVSRVFYP